MRAQHAWVGVVAVSIAAATLTLHRSLEDLERPPAVRAPAPARVAPAEEPRVVLDSASCLGDRRGDVTSLSPDDRPEGAARGGEASGHAPPPPAVPDRAPPSRALERAWLAGPIEPLLDAARAFATGDRARSAGLLALHAPDPRALAAELWLLGDPEPPVRGAAARALTAWKDEGIRRLLDRLDVERDASVQRVILAIVAAHAPASEIGRVLVLVDRGECTGEASDAARAMSRRGGFGEPPRLAARPSETEVRARARAATLAALEAARAQ